MTLRYRLGFLGAWALFLVAAGLSALAAVAQWENWRDSRKLARLERIDRMISSRLGGKVEELRETSGETEARLRSLRSAMARAEIPLDDSRDTAQTIIVSTAENRLRVRRAGRTIFEAICSTGKGTTLEIGGRRTSRRQPAASGSSRRKRTPSGFLPTGISSRRRARKSWNWFGCARARRSTQRRAPPCPRTPRAGSGRCSPATVPAGGP